MKHAKADSDNLTCGTCQWFAVGYNGQSCRKLRNVDISDEACIEYTELLDDPYQEIASDKFISGVREQLRHSRYRIDQSILEELKGYIINIEFAGAELGSRQDIEGVLNILKSVVAYSARVSNIYTAILDVNYEVEKLGNDANLWLFSKYAQIRDLKNEHTRKSVFNRLIPEYHITIKNIEKVLITAKYLDSKLDKSDRTLQAILRSSEKLWFSKNPQVGGGTRGVY